METIKVYSQSDLDKITDDFRGCIEIHGGEWFNPIRVNRRWGNSSVVARENSSVEARENSSVVAWGNSSVEARENSSVVAWGNSSVEARGNSSVVAWGNSSVVAWGNSSVEAWGNSSVVAWGNSSVEARENSSVEARENSSVEAWGNSSVEARENSSVEARENSSVEAWGNSSVGLKGYAQARIYSDKVYCQSEGNSRIILPLGGIKDYIDYFGVKEIGDSVIMYKAVHKCEGVYCADYYPDFTYKIGETAKESVDKNVYEDCGMGLHVSTLDWALRFGRGFKNLAILECEVPKAKTVVYKFTDGKIRTSELKVLREVPLEECGVYGKILAKKISK